MEFGMRTRSHRRRRVSSRNQRGAGLIEVLVALLVMAIGVLGIAAMQAAALRNSQSALERSQGVINTYAIIDAMRANLEEARNGAYVLARTCTVPAAGNSALAANDIAFWMEHVQGNLGEGACGAIDCADGRCAVTIIWNDTRGSGGLEDFSFTTEVQL